MKRTLRLLALLAITVAGLLTARSLHTEFNLASRDYYLDLNPTLLSVDRPGELGTCDMQTCIQQLAQMAPTEGTVQVGACDLFMYNGGVAVSGFLGFLTLYLAFVVAGFFLYSITPRSWRKAVLLAWSLLFLGVALPLRPALWLLESVLGLCFLAVLPLPEGTAWRRLRAGLLLAAGTFLLATLGREVAEATAVEFFRLSRMPSGPEAFPPGTPVREALDFLQLGVMGQPPRQLEGFPYLFLALAFLMKGYRRLLWLAYDLWVGRTGRVGALDFLLYFVGLPALIGNAATPSYQEFVDARGREPGPVEGASTLAMCLGVASMLYVLVVMLGYSPGVRVLFPRCDLDTVTPAWIWLRLASVYVIEYLFLLATEQASIGVARLFGYGLRDNYERPLTATSMADYWRRWNIYWREFLVSVFFWPVTLALARRSRRPLGWHLVLAAFVTFAATFVLNIVPLLLVSGFLQEQFYVPQSAQPGPGMIEPGIAPQTTRWMAVVPSLAIYYVLEGFFVSLSLLLEFGRSNRPRRPQPTGLQRVLLTVLAVGGTFLLVAALRVFLTDTLTPQQQWEMLQKALFLR